LWPEARPNPFNLVGCHGAVAREAFDRPQRRILVAGTVACILVLARGTALLRTGAAAGSYSA
jgi:hypothetical protein